MSHIKRWLAFGCTHAPLHDEDAIEFVCEQIEEHQPDVVVHLGDLFEADAASRWPSEYQFTLEDEFRAADEVLRHIRGAKPDARRVYIPGNHCDNLGRAQRIPVKHRSLVQLDKHPELNRELLTHWERPAKYVVCPEASSYRLGQVVFAHGVKANETADNWHAHFYCHDFGLYVGAHTHRPTSPTQAKIGRSDYVNRWHANAGCTREMDPEYAKRSDTRRWGQAVVVGEADERALSKAPRRSRCWAAETRIFKMNDGSADTDLTRMPG